MDAWKSLLTLLAVLNPVGVIPFFIHFTAKLTPAQRGMFSRAKEPGSVKKPARTIPEPHGSWVPLLEAAWLERYGA